MYNDLALRFEIFFLLIFWIIIEAIKEGLFYRNLKMWSKQVEILEKIILIVMLYLFPHDISNLWKIALAYAFQRFTIFDIAFNLSAKLPLLFSGTTTWFYDQWMKGMKNNYPSIYWMNCLIAMCVSYGIIFNELSL